MRSSASFALSACDKYTTLCEKGNSFSSVSSVDNRNQHELRHEFRQVFSAMMFTRLRDENSLDSVLISAH